MTARLPTILVVAAAAASFLPVAVHGAATSPPSVIAVKLASTRAALRDLWSGHVFWVRNVVDATFDGDAAAVKSAEAQVVANAKSIAGAIEPFYGKAASDQLFTLLAGHWGAIKGYLDATRAGDKAKAAAATTSLTANAGEIARFLGGANPNLPVDSLNGLLAAHGAHHMQQIDEFKARQFDAEAKTWAAMAAHMNMISDALADGIAKQFPDKFR